MELNMDASKLEAQPPGDIVIEIVQVWEKIVEGKCHSCQVL